MPRLRISTRWGMVADRLFGGNSRIGREPDGFKSKAGWIEYQPQASAGKCSPSLHRGLFSDGRLVRRNQGRRYAMPSAGYRMRERSGAPVHRRRVGRPADAPPVCADRGVEGAKEGSQGCDQALSVLSWTGRPAIYCSLNLITSFL